MALPTMYTGPLDRTLAEQGVYNTRVPRLPGTTPGIMPPQTNTGGGLQATVAPQVQTGGGLQAYVAPNGNTGIVPPNVQTGGPGQVQVPTVLNGGLHVTTGGGLPPVQGVPAAPGTTPTPAPVPAPGQQFDVNSILNQLWAGQGGNQPQVDPATLANQYMTSLLGSNSPYIQSARQAGMEAANARGLMNSSLAAGSAERAAVDASMPMFQQAYNLNAQREQNNFNGSLQRTQLGMNLLGQRENNAFQGSQAQLDRNLKEKLQSDAVYQQNWLSNQDFTRQFNAALSMIPVQTATQFSQLIQQYALENPEVYTPQVISGMTTFFSQTMGNLLKQYFPNLK